MIKYAKIVNGNLGVVDVICGNPEDVYRKEIDPATGEEKNIYYKDLFIAWGFSEMAVEQGSDGKWYLKGHAPAPPEVKVVRTFAKDAIWVATKDMIIDPATGITAWEAFKNFLIDSGLWEGWTMQAYLLEENPFFAEFYPRAVAVFGSELVDKVLAASVVESKTVVVK